MIVAGGNREVLAIGVAPHALGPAQRLLLVVADCRVEELAIVAGLGSHHAFVRRRIGDLRREVEVLVVVGQVRRRHARLLVLPKLLEGQPSLLGQAGLDTGASHSLRTHILPVVEIAIHLRRSSADDVDVQVLAPLVVAVQTGIDAHAQGVQI